MNALIFYIVTMSITVVNESPHEIYVSVTLSGSDNGVEGLTEDWYPVEANGKGTWERSQKQLIHVVTKVYSGRLTETFLGTPDDDVRIPSLTPRILDG